VIDQDLRLDQLLDHPPVRWPDRPDLKSQLVATVLVLSPRASRLAVGALTLAVEEPSLDAVIGRLYQLGAKFGQTGQGEAAGGCFELADVITDWRDRG
jgi:hypothetical protein